jgi:hypothetical protein
MLQIMNAHLWQSCAFPRFLPRRVVHRLGRSFHAPGRGAELRGMGRYTLGAISVHAPQSAVPAGWDTSGDCCSHASRVRSTLRLALFQVGAGHLDSRDLDSMTCPFQPSTVKRTRG